ncbi:MAG: VOC family protein [Rhodoplanes sp.]
MVRHEGNFIWYELMTTDTEAAKAFYVNVLGWGARDVSIPGMGYTLFTVEGVSVSGLMDLPEDANEMGAKPNWIGYVGTDDVDATANLIKQLGGTVHVPPTDIPGVSRFSVVADPQMASLGLMSWLGPRLTKPTERRKPGQIGWYELLTADWEKALAFYGEAFGWEKAQAIDTGEMGTYQMFSARGQTIGGMFTKPLFVSSPFWLYYFNVEDIDAAVTRVMAGKGRILIGPIEISDGNWIVQCADPQGAIFALVGKRSEDRRSVSWSTEWSGRLLRGRILDTKADSTPRGFGNSNPYKGH